MMKIPSLHLLGKSFLIVLKRFPFQVILALLSAFIWCLYIERSRSPYAASMGNFLLVANLAFTLSLALRLYSEVKAFSWKKNLTLQLLSLILCAGIYMHANPMIYPGDIYKVMPLLVSFHLLVSFAPFLGNRNVHAFWEFNKELFIRFLAGVLYAGVLYLGLALAILAVDSLFNVQVSSKVYGYLFAVVAAGFSSIFFLAGIPFPIQASLNEERYPKGLKVFTQYVLIPLMSVYLAILWIYGLKILMEWSLPKGLVAALVLGYAVFGIFSLLLIYPVREKEGNGWIRIFSRFFYLTLLPLIFLLVLAILKRVQTYGITEARYLLIVLAIWLTCLSLYALLSGKYPVKAIPLSLFVLGVIYAYGPLNATWMAENSQTRRLDKLLTLKDSHAAREKEEVVRYLVRTHGLISLKPFVNRDVEVVEKRIDSVARAKRLFPYEVQQIKLDSAFALLAISRPGKVEDQVSFFNKEEGLVELRGFEKLIRMDYGDFSFHWDGEMIKVSRVRTDTQQSESSRWRMEIGDRWQHEIELTSLFMKAYEKYRQNELQRSTYQSFYLPSSDMELPFTCGNYQFKLVLNQMNGEIRRDEPFLFNFEGVLLMKRIGH